MNCGMDLVDWQNVEMSVHRIVAFYGHTQNNQCTCKAGVFIINIADN